MDVAENGRGLIWPTVPQHFPGRTEGNHGIPGIRDET
jgi:hypothetical protein